MRKGTRENAGITGAAAETTGGRMTGVGGDGKVRREGAEEEMTEGEGEAEMMTEEGGGMVIETTGTAEETETEIEETETGDETEAPQEEVVEEETEVEIWLQGFKVWPDLKEMEGEGWETGMEEGGWAMMEEEWEVLGWVTMVPEWEAVLMVQEWVDPME